MEDGVAFCPRCNAPQIRVPASLEPSEPGAVPLPPGTPGEVPPAGRRLIGIEWKQMRRRAVPVAIALALLMRPLGALFFVLMPAAGALVVWLHRRHTNEPVSTRSGLRAGAFTGAVSFAFFLATSAVTVAYERLVLDRVDHVTMGLRASLDQLIVTNPDPRVQDAARWMLATPEAMAGFFVFSLVIFFVLFVSLCAAGGAWGASISRPRPGA